MTQYELTADSAGVTALVSCAETVDENANSSTLAITVQIKSRMWYGVTYWLEGTVGQTTLDNTEHYAYLGALNTYYPVEQTFYMTVPHDLDGTGTAAVAISIKGRTRTGGAGSGWLVQSTLAVPLTPIARASTVGATDAQIGAVSVIAVTRKNSAYSHTLAYSFGGLSGFIAPDGTITAQPVYSTAAAVPFRLPEEFYYQLTDAATGICTITCMTYNGVELVGAPVQCGFTVTAAKSNCAPILTARVRDVNEKTLELTADPEVLVRFRSSARLESTAQGQFGATILEKTADAVLEAPESGSFSFYAVDSRGYTTELSVQKTMIPYVELTAHVSCRRTGNTHSTALVTVQGSCYNGSFGRYDNVTTVEVFVGETAYSAEIFTEGNSYRAELELAELDYTQSHLIRVQVEDLLSSVTAETTLQQGVPVFDWGKRDFAFHVPITAPVINGFSNLAFKAWPVGAVISVADGRNPADTIGGKWEKLQDIGLDLDLWRRLQSADLLGSGVLGSFVLEPEA